MEKKQDEIDGVMSALEKYVPRDNKYVEAENKLLNNVKNFYRGREKIIERFKNKIFPLYYDKEYEYEMKIKREEKRKRRKKKEKKEEQKNKMKKQLM